MIPAPLIAFAENAPQPAAPPQGVDVEDAFARIRFLGVPGTSPPVKLLDCRALSLSLPAPAATPAVAARFAELRHDDGERLRGAVVQDPVTATCDVPLPDLVLDETKGSAVFRAPEIAWKWDATLQGDRLLFTRSASGDLHVVARLALSGESDVKIVDVEVQRKLCGGDPHVAVALAQYLARVHVLGKVTPHPLPPGAPTKTARDAFMYSWSLHGRAAFFAWQL